MGVGPGAEGEDAAPQLTELAAHERGANLQAALAKARRGRPRWVPLRGRLRAAPRPGSARDGGFDPGGWSSATFAAITDAGLDMLTYRKAPFERLPAEAFTAQVAVR